MFGGTDNGNGAGGGQQSSMERRGGFDPPDGSAFAFPASNATDSNSSSSAMLMDHHASYNCNSKQPPNKSPSAVWSLYSPTMQGMSSIFDDTGSSIMSMGTSLFEFPVGNGNQHSPPGRFQRSPLLEDGSGAAGIVIDGKEGHEGLVHSSDHHHHQHYNHNHQQHFEYDHQHINQQGGHSRISPSVAMGGINNNTATTASFPMLHGAGSVQAFVSGLADSSAAAVQFMPLSMVAPPPPTGQSGTGILPPHLHQSPLANQSFIAASSANGSAVTPPSSAPPPLSGKNLPPILQRSYRPRGGNSLKFRTNDSTTGGKTLPSSSSTPALGMGGGLDGEDMTALSASSPLSTTSSIVDFGFRDTNASRYGGGVLVEQQPKRDAHIASEQRRRAIMKDAYDRLQELLPTSEYRKPSKANLLSAAVNYIGTLQRKITLIGKQNERLRLENHLLMVQIGQVAPAVASVASNDINGGGDGRKGPPNLAIHPGHIQPSPNH